MAGACAWVCVEMHENCSKIAEAEAAVSVNEKEWLVMHVQLQLDELRGKLQCFAKFCVLGQVFLSCPLLMWCSSASGLLRGCRGHLHLAGQTASGAASLVEHYNSAANALFLQHTQSVFWDSRITLSCEQGRWQDKLLLAGSVLSHFCYQSHIAHRTIT